MSGYQSIDSFIIHFESLFQGERSSIGTSTGHVDIGRIVKRGPGSIGDIAELNVMERQLVRK